MEINRSIHHLRIAALLLFLVPLIGLIGSLILHNSLITVSKFASKNLIPPVEEMKLGNKTIVECSEENNWCNWYTHDQLGQCQEYFVNIKHIDADGVEILNQSIATKLKNKKVKLTAVLEVVDIKVDNCILNSNYRFIYKVFPQTFERIVFKTAEIKLGTRTTVNPILYGETSISNIVKRFPINYVFKPLMFLTSLIMLAYWLYYNKIFNFLFKEDKVKVFYIFGILSAVFLFLHVLFLGNVYESKILSQLRRSYIVFFILFEVLAQVFLVRGILNKRNQLKKYLNNNIVIYKLFFVSAVCISTLIIVAILLLYNLSSKVDYILEWNYFLILMVFYFLSHLMWKKTNL